MAWNSSGGNYNYVEYKFPSNITPIGLYFMSNRTNNNANQDRHFGYIWASGSTRVYSCMDSAVFSTATVTGWVYDLRTYRIPLNRGNSQYYICAIGTRTS